MASIPRLGLFDGQAATGGHQVVCVDGSCMWQTRSSAADILYTVCIPEAAANKGKNGRLTEPVWFSLQAA